MSWAVPEGEAEAQQTITRTNSNTMPASEDVTVDIQLLMTHPKAALLAVLQLLNGWQHVRVVEAWQGLHWLQQRHCGMSRHCASLLLCASRLQGATHTRRRGVRSAAAGGRTSRAPPSTACVSRPVVVRAAALMHPCLTHTTHTTHNNHARAGHRG